MKIRSRWLNRALVWLVIIAGRVLFWTCRKVHVQNNPRCCLDFRRGPDDPERFILATWHDGLLIPTFLSPRYLRVKVCCLVSKHQDGGFLADAMAIMGYRTVRGSTSRGGAQAVRELVDDTAGYHIVITPDGPRGPRRELKLGALYVAAHSGRAIVAGAYACRRSWRIKGSWTDMLVPKPFTTIYLVHSDPIVFAADLPRAALEARAGFVQAELDRMQGIADALARGEPPPAAMPYRQAA